jgi:hypothetical protein
MIAWNVGKQLTPNMAKVTDYHLKNDGYNFTTDLV